MRQGCAKKIWLALALWLGVALVAAAQDIHRLPYSYAHAVSLAAPSVVNIYTTREPPSFQRLEPPRDFWQQHQQSHVPRSHTQTIKRSSLGSGVIVDTQGYILTNFHVVRNAQDIAVVLPDGQRVAAKVVGSDSDTDLAVVRIQAKSLRPITRGDSNDLRVGDIVLAIGNPFGLGQTVTQGIVSALGRNTVGINQLENYIQTDAAINPGNSGGALVNARGELVGINTGIYSRSGGYQGVGFAIPVNAAMNVLHQIIHNGYVTRGWIAIEVKTLSPYIAQALKSDVSSGVVVLGMLPGGPAEKGGLKIRDIITQVDNTRIESTRGLINYIAQKQPGDSVRVHVRRDNQPMVFKVRVTAKARAMPNGARRAPYSRTPQGATPGKPYLPDDR